jgi:polar amino acid transport system permease protein
MWEFMRSPSVEQFPQRVFTPRTACTLLIGFALILFADELCAQGLGDPDEAGVIPTVWKWLPLILFGPLTAHIGTGGLVITGQLGGFALNVLVSVLVMAVGTVLGIVLGLFLVSQHRPMKGLAGAVTQFFRNTPWLVLLFFSTFLLPYQVHVFGYIIPIPDWIKASAALTLPIMANVAEIMRGAVQSIPASQWHSAESLAFSRAQTFRLIILPQCVKRMTPPWMNWYAILMMESSLISIVGVNEAMTLTHDALSAEGRSDLLIPMYGMLLLLFFVYCYPIARWTQSLERRFAISN